MMGIPYDPSVMRGNPKLEVLIMGAQVKLTADVALCMLVSQIADEFTLEIESPHYAKAQFWTDVNRYRVALTLPTEKNPKGHLGCMATSRKPRAGEGWARSGPLPDGPHDDETWDKIVRAIVKFEAVKVHVPKNWGNRAGEGTTVYMPAEGEAYFVPTTRKVETRSADDDDDDEQARAGP